ncbi:hypothetical protein EDD11_003105 [Mortierella claussenii]|nr:hypothetical protein EDD11_003105 [Mortierella claussenii]
MHQVVSCTGDFDFPFLNFLALEFALFKTYAIPSISNILAGTRQFERHCLKRTEDTTLIMLEMVEPYARKTYRDMKNEGKVDEKEDQKDEWREKTALERMNFIHGHYPIQQEDYLYTLAMFVLEPARWIDRFEWRTTTDLEKNAILAMWIHHGERMHIQNIPRSYKGMEAWAEEYEARHTTYSQSNATIATATTNLFLTLIPTGLHPLGRQVIACLLSDRLRTAFAIPPPPRGLTTLVVTILKLRGWFVRHCLLPRRLPLIRTALTSNSEDKFVPRWNKYKAVYPHGYKIQELGPDRFLNKCPVS